MNNIAMSRAAAALLRALLDRAGSERNRILLSEIRSYDWQSLTFTGERHVIFLRVPGADADAIVDMLTRGLEEAEFLIPGQIVADIRVAGAPIREKDGSLTIAMEALTITE